MDCLLPESAQKAYHASPAKIQIDHEGEAVRRARRRLGERQLLPSRPYDILRLLGAGERAEVDLEAEVLLAREHHLRRVRVGRPDLHDRQKQLRSASWHFPQFNSEP